MRNAHSLRSVRIELPETRVVRGSMVAWAAVGVFSLQVGCASHHYDKSSHSAASKRGVELLFPRCVPDPRCEVDTAPADTGAMTEVRAPLRTVSGEGMAKVALCDEDKAFARGPQPVDGVGDEYGANYTIRPGEYTFLYDHPSFRPVYGALRLRAVDAPRAKDFIRHTSIPLTPSPSGRSVLTEADLSRARNGDVVTRVVFVADMPAVRERLDNIDKSLREIAHVRTSLKEQLAYWQGKLTERRVNARYSDFGWGVDIPGSDLAILQSVVGPERYHWHRFSEADDQVRTYEEKIAKLDVPERDLKEERDALRNLLQSADVIFRTDNLLVVSGEMTRPFHDPVHEVSSTRGKDPWYGSAGKTHRPYYYSGMANKWLAPTFREVGAPSKTTSDPVGEVLMVVQAGTRRPGACDERCCLAK